MISRYTVLHDQRPTNVIPGREVIPPLLRLCIQTRQEAISIYFSEQESRLSVLDNDTTAVDRFGNAFGKYRLEDVSFLQPLHDASSRS